MPVRAITRLYDAADPPEEIGIRIDGVGKDGFFEALYADIPGNSWNQNRLNKFTARAQDLIDVRIPLSSLPADDPDKTIDPGRPDFFHDGGDLVARSVIISDVSFTDRLNFTITRAR
jgi:hypothetical protein